MGMALSGPDWFWMAPMAAIDFSLYLKFFVGLFAIINPLGLLPVFVSLTGHMQPEERRKTNTTAHIAVMIILMVSMCMGQLILDGFGISLASFRIARGLAHHPDRLVHAAGQARRGEAQQAGEGELAARESIAVVPWRYPDGRARCHLVLHRLCQPEDPAPAGRHVPGGGGVRLLLLAHLPRRPLLFS